MRPAESFIRQPVRSLQTMLRIISQDDPRLPTVIPDGIYGPQTMTTVSAFQRLNGIPVTGVANQETWEQIVDAYDLAQVRVEKAQPIEILMDAGKVYRSGDRGAYIYLLQSMLTQLSLDHPQITAPDHSGILDASTVNALSAFQRLAGLEVTGTLDRITWKHIVLHFTANVHHSAPSAYNGQSGEFA